MWIAVIDSIWFSFLYPITLITFVFLGHLFAHRFYTKKAKSWKPIGIENGVFGVFALILSFTLILSGNAVNNRNATLHREADVIAELHRRCKFYDNELKELIDNYLLRCLSMQLENPGPDAEECLQMILQVETLDKELDNALLSYASRHPESKATLENVLVLIEKIGAEYFLLLYSFRERTPAAILLVLVLFLNQRIFVIFQLRI